MGKNVLLAKVYQKCKGVLIAAALFVGLVGLLIAVAFTQKNSERIFSFVLNRSVKAVCEDCSVSVTNFRTSASKTKGVQINAEISVKLKQSDQTICSADNVRLDLDLSKVLSSFSIPIRINATSFNLTLDQDINKNFNTGKLFELITLSNTKKLFTPEILEITSSSLTLGKVRYAMELKPKDNLGRVLTLVSDNSESQIEMAQVEETGVNTTVYTVHNLPAQVIASVVPQTFKSKLLDSVSGNLFISGRLEMKSGAKVRTLNASFHNQPQKQASPEQVPEFLVALSSKDWQDKIQIDQLNVSLPGGKERLSANGQIKYFSKLLGERVALDLAYKIDKLNLQSASSVWPQELASKIRDWVITSVKAGQLTDLHGQIKVKDIFSSAADNISFDGRAGFQSLNLKYMPDLPQLDDLAGQVTFDNAGVLFDVQAGKMTEVSIKEGSSVKIDLMDSEYPLIVKAKAQGIVKDFVDFISKENLAQLKKKKLDLKTIAGVAEAEVNIRCPLAKKSTLKDLTLDVDASLTDVAFDALERFKLQGPLALSIHKHLLSISGAPLINGNSSKLQWQTNLLEQAEFDNKLTIDTVVDTSDKALSCLYDKVKASGGKIISSLEYIGKKGDEQLTINADLNAPLIQIQDINLTKNPNKEASFRLIAANKDGQGWKTQACELISAAEDIKALSSFELSNDLNEISKFESLVHSKDNDIKIDLALKKDEASFFIHGNHIVPNKSHLLRFLTSQNFSGNRKTSLKLKIDKATMKNGVIFKKILGQFECQHNACKSSDLTMQLTDGKKTNSILKVYKQDDIITLHTDNAAALLRGFDAYSNIEGGTMDIALETDNQLQKNRHLNGSIYVKDFKALKTPIIAKLIIMTPFTQIVERLKGQDLINFKEFKGTFTIENNVITVHNSVATGELLSATISGHIDLTNHRLSLRGKLIPNCLVNNLMSKIQNKKEHGPENYQIATQYKISGKLDAPVVHVNPISVLMSVLTKPLAIL
jgi:hypothetical protein